jgi:hypothetical protein
MSSEAWQNGTAKTPGNDRARLISDVFARASIQSTGRRETSRKSLGTSGGLTCAPLRFKLPFWVADPTGMSCAADRQCGGRVGGPGTSTLENIYTVSSIPVATSTGLTSMVYPSLRI